MTAPIGPGPAYRSETETDAAPVAASRGRDFGARGSARPLAGLLTVLAILGIAMLAAALFRDSFAKTVPVTVLSPRAGLVMNPDAKVRLRGVQVGKVASIESRPDGTAALHLAIDPAQSRFIPANVGVDIASSTVFGSKFVELLTPATPSAQTLQAGQVLQGEHVTVEINTVFQQLTSVLGKVDPTKLNETLGALSTGLNDRGEKLGQALSDLDSFLAKLEPNLPALSNDLRLTPIVANAYADAAPDLTRILDNSTRLSTTIVQEQQNLDALLLSALGLADLGQEVIGGNRQALTDMLGLLVPTTDLLNRYHEALNCGLGGLAILSHNPPLPLPGVLVSTGLTMGVERYRYPSNLPKVAAKGGPQCHDLPRVPYETRPPYVVSDNGTNPAVYGNEGILLNSDGLKQALFGPVDGPPRNTVQMGQPG